jgi:hypothetical protein
MGKLAPASNRIPNGIQTVTLDAWKDYCEKLAVINRKGNPREEFKRLHVTLENVGAIGIWNENVWVVT